MVVRLRILLLAVAVSSLAGFVGGVVVGPRSATSAQTAPSTPPVPRVVRVDVPLETSPTDGKPVSLPSPAPLALNGPGDPAALPTEPRTDADTVASSGATGHPAEDAGTSSDCGDELKRLRAESKARQDAEGKPIVAPSNLPARFAQQPLLDAATAALKQSRVPGSIEAIDCSEHPCIVYGRIHGDDDLLERFERARALSVYDDDILTMLMWSATDEKALPHRRAGDPRPEQILFAMAAYSYEDLGKWGEALDRRVRVRTADLWNAMRPSDEN